MIWTNDACMHAWLMDDPAAGDWASWQYIDGSLRQQRNVQGVPLHRFSSCARAVYKALSFLRNA